MQTLGTALVLLSVALAHGQDATPSRMFPDGRAHDFGMVTSGEIAKHSFRIVNTSDVPLRFDVRTSTGCVKGVVPKLVIQPNEETTLEVNVDSRRFQGAKEMKVFLTTQGGAGFTFTIKAESALKD